MRELKGSERKTLRGLAHPLRPVVQVGKDGVVEGLIRAVDRALDAHELIKVKFVERKEEKEALSQEIAKKTGSQIAGLIGNVAILYREHPDPDKRQIHLPES